MRFLIFGAGAIGSAIGAKLLLSGNEVHLVGRREHIEKIQESGLRISGIWGEKVVSGFQLHVDLSSVPSSEVFDAVFITVKTFSTDEAGRTLGEAGIKSRVFISAQNGLGNNEILERYLNPVANARVIFGVVFENPGEVKITVWGGPILLGFWERKLSHSLSSLLKDIADCLSSSGLPAEYTDDIRTPIWEKAIYNSALNPLSVILNTTYGGVVDNPHSLEIVKEIIFEGVFVGKKEGANLQDGEDFFSYFMTKLIPPTREHISSMIQDIKRRGKTEIDSMCGAIYRYGLKHNFYAKVNFSLWKIIKSLEQTKF